MATAAPSPSLPLAPEPPELITVGRIKSAGELFDRSGEWAGLPIPWKEVLDQEVSLLGPDFFEPSAALELAVVLAPGSPDEPEPLFAVSFPLTGFDGSVEYLRSQGTPLEAVSQDIYYLSFESLDCAVARSNGVASGRLICSEEREALDALAPYMSRTLPLEGLGSQDLWLQLRAGPFQARYGKKAQMIKVGVPFVLRELVIDNARFDAAVADAAHAVAAELISVSAELDTLTLTGALSPTTQELEVAFTLGMKGQQSWLSRVAAAAAPNAASAPEMFWRLPADVGSASYSIATDAVSLSEPITNTLAELIGGGLEKLAVNPALVERLVEATRSEAGQKVQVVMGHGAGPITSTGSEVERVAQSFGYYVMGVQGDRGSYARMLDALVDVLNDPQLRNSLSRGEQKWIKSLPKIGRQEAPSSYPEGTRLYTLEIDDKLVAKLRRAQGKLAKNATEKVGKLKAELAIVESGETTWIGVSATPGSLVGPLATVIAPGGSAATLQGRSGLDRLRSIPALSGGFATLASVTEPLAAVGPELEELDVSAELILRSMPNRGSTPILFQGHTSAQGPAFRYGVTLPQAAARDLVGAVVAIVAAADDNPKF